MLISAVIITKNEENNVLDCVESLSFVDEIIVVDDNSTDRTIEILNNLKDRRIKIFKKALNNDFSSQRNFALRQAQSEWVLFVDADERVPEALASEISGLHLPIGGQISNNNKGYYVKRRDFLWNKELRYGETSNIKLLRLARKDAGVWKGNVHEVWEVKGKTGEFKNSLLHYPHKTIKEFLQEIDYYTSLRAKELYNNKIKTRWFSIIVYPLGKFISNFILKRGFLDGSEGFIFAIMMSLHSFLVRGKLWLLWTKK